MKKLLGILVLGLLFSGNVDAGEINELLKKGYKITKEEFFPGKPDGLIGSAKKVFTLNQITPTKTVLTLKIKTVIIIDKVPI